MALILNLPIFAQNGGHFVCYHGNRDLAAKKLNVFYSVRPTIQFVQKQLHSLFKFKINHIKLNCLSLIVAK